jgi:chorismate dehydratase
MLRIGHIDYANCTPIFHALRDQGSCEGFQFIRGVPAQLNEMLALGQLDVCPSSSIEYALYPGQYLILPQLSISSCGAVGSVLLLSRIPVESLDGHTVLLSSESATSVNLLKVLLAKRFGCQCQYARSSASFDESLLQAPAVLLIGDAALRAALRKPDVYVYDLGKLWHDWTGLPFVFALWLCSRKVSHEHPQELMDLARRLVEAKQRSRNSTEALAESAPEADWMGRQRLMDYWNENISYELEPHHLEGLLHFYRNCAELGLIESVPEFHFLED